MAGAARKPEGRRALLPSRLLEAVLQVDVECDGLFAVRLAELGTQLAARKKKLSTRDPHARVA